MEMKSERRHFRGAGSFCLCEPPLFWVWGSIMRDQGSWGWGPFYRETMGQGCEGCKLSSRWDPYLLYVIGKLGPRVCD